MKHSKGCDQCVTSVIKIKQQKTFVAQKLNSTAAFHVRKSHQRLHLSLAQEPSNDTRTCCFDDSKAHLPTLSYFLLEAAMRYVLTSQAQFICWISCQCARYHHCARPIMPSPLSRGKLRVGVVVSRDTKNYENLQPQTREAMICFRHRFREKQTSRIWNRLSFLPSSPVVEKNSLMVIYREHLSTCRWWCLVQKGKWKENLWVSFIWIICRK